MRGDMRFWTTRIAAGAIAFARAGGAVGAAQGGGQGQPAAPETASAAPVLDVSGFWELSFDSRKVPPANLAPGVTKAMIEAKQKRDEHSVRWCNIMGTPFIMDPGRPIDIRQGGAEIIIAVESFATPRHIYLNRSTHISPELWDPSTN